MANPLGDQIDPVRRQGDPQDIAALDGMRVGGKRVVRVTPDVGYLPELGTPPPGELPPGASFEMEVEVLSG